MENPQMTSLVPRMSILRKVSRMQVSMLNSAKYPRYIDSKLNEIQTNDVRGNNNNILKCSRKLGQLKLSHTRNRIECTLSELRDKDAKLAITSVFGALKNGDLGARFEVVAGASDKMARYSRRIERRKELLRKFKKRVNFFILLTRVWQIHKFKLTMLLPSYGPLQETTPTDKKKQLLFDITSFRTQKEAGVSNKMKSILAKPPNTRTEDDIHYIRVALRNYKAVSGCPVHIQRLLAQRAWIETYNEKRMIVREGNPPMCFYLILSGSALGLGNSGCTPASPILNPGDVFEEGCLLHGTHRQLTVITRRKTELLCVTNQDYVNIFMGGGLGQNEAAFLQTLWSFRYWPVNILLDHPAKAIFSYFIPGKVLVKDSQENDWIYLIKSGSCNVIKTLKIRKKTRSTAYKDFFGTKKIKILPEFANPRLYLDMKLEQLANDERRTNKWSHLRSPPEINVQTDTEYRRRLKAKNQIEKPKKKIRLDGDLETRTTSSYESTLTKGPFMSRSETAISLVLQSESAACDLVQPGALSSRPTNEKLFTNLATSRAKRNSLEESYIVVNVLTKGQSFGFHDVMNEAEPSLSLVSNGAECILIDKRFYMDHVTDDQRRELIQIWPYPTENELQTKLESHMTWQNFRQETLRHCIDDLRNRRQTIRYSLPII